MRRSCMPYFLVLLLIASLSAPLASQTTPPETQPQNQEPYTFRVEVVERTARAVNYRHRGGATKVDFEGTQLLPAANGEAKVEAKEGYTEIEVEFDDLKPASMFGPEYLTYVLWAVTPQGRSMNLGEVVLDGNRSKLNVTTDMPAFAMVVTAEPHFAVTQPSNVVVMENVIRPDTRGRTEVISTKFELVDRSAYKPPVELAPPENQGSLAKFDRDQAQPAYYVVQARNAVRIARVAQADQFAPEVLKRSETLLSQAEGYLVKKQGKPAITVAKQSAQAAEEARLVAVRRAEEARRQAEREAAAERQRKAEEAAAQAEEQQRLEAERRAAAEKQAEESRLKSLEAQLAAERAARERAEAQAQQQASAAEAERARQAAQAAEQERLRLIEEQRVARERLRQQLNQILETRESARGLIVNMSDVLFDFGKATLKSGAKLKLAKIAGILVAHPTLSLQIEGHTDNVGSDEYNQKLSQRRAETVKEFLVSQGVAEANVSTVGLGESQPVASNNSAAGRQQNRRVEVVVSGEEIGVQTEPAQQ